MLFTSGVWAGVRRGRRRERRDVTAGSDGSVRVERVREASERRGVGDGE